MSEKGLLTVQKMEDLLGEDKPNQTPKIKVSMNRLNKILPSYLKNDREREEFIIQCVDYYCKHKIKSDIER